ncbi:MULTISPECIES: DUF3408 domain-containing protein [Bacteroidales]|jgi:hypothetical protein|uniref:DUF3408 domain-containing protein n=1 Tax=Bacteroidales TaxID=171549 RepID=UPI000F001108|nr:MULTISPECIES: DUF3408 domain-containing protein [Bacteroidales]RHR83422.1 DUF3408 domain-containing protein [Bacteroides sp. AF16-49]
MAKRAKAGELDESLIIQSFKDTELLANPADAITGKPDEDTPAEETGGKVVQVEDNSDETETPAADTAPKGKSRRRKGSYDEVFLKNKDLKARQPVYISQEIHQEIKKVVHLLALSNQEISVGGYINNVLADHLEQHKEDIAELRRRQIENL